MPITFPLVESLLLPNIPPPLSTLVRREITPTSRGNFFLVFLLRLNCAKKRAVALALRQVSVNFCFDHLVGTDFAGRSMLFVLLFLSLLVFIVREGSAAASVNRDESVETFGTNS